MFDSMDGNRLIKETILKNALNLVNELGYGALTLSELARYCETTKQRIYYHFKTPEDIILALAEKWGSSGQSFTIKALADTQEVGAYKILAMCDGMYAWLQHNHDLAKFGILLFQTTSRNKQLKAIMNSTRETGRIRIESFLLTDSVFKKMKKEKLEEITTSIHSAMYSSFFYIAIFNDFKQIELHKKNCIKVVKDIIDCHLR